MNASDALFIRTYAHILMQCYFSGAVEFVLQCTYYVYIWMDKPDLPGPAHVNVSTKICNLYTSIKNYKKYLCVPLQQQRNCKFW